METPPGGYVEYPRGSQPVGPPTDRWQKPPEINFEVIGQAFTLFQQQWKPWVLASLIYTVIWVSLFLAAYIPAIALPFYLERNPNVGTGLVVGYIAWVGIAYFVAVVAYYGLMGGLYRMALDHIDGKPVAANGFFRFHGTFFKHGGTAGLTVMGLMVGLLFCIFPGLIFGGVMILAHAAVSERGLGPVQAMHASWNALRPHWLMATAFYLVMGVILSASFYVFLPVVLPVYILSIALTYRNFFPKPSPPVVQETPRDQLFGSPPSHEPNVGG